MTVEITFDKYLDENTLQLVENLGRKHCNLTRWIEIIKETPTTDGASRFRVLFEPLENVIKVIYEVYTSANKSYYFDDKLWQAVTIKLFPVEHMEDAYIVGRRSVRGLMQLVFKEKRKKEW